MGEARRGGIKIFARFFARGSGANCCCATLDDPRYVERSVHKGNGGGTCYRSMYFGGGFPLVNGLPPPRPTWKISGVTDCALNRLSLSLCGVSCRCTRPIYSVLYIYIYIYTLTYILIPTVHPLRSQRRRYKRGYYLLL